MSDEIESTDLPEEAQPAHEGAKAPDPGDRPPPQAELVVKRGGLETDEVFTLVPPAVIGRFDPSVGPVDVDLGGIPEGQYVSRRHAKVTWEDGVWSIQDLGSSNGTYVLRDDFERVESSTIENGDEIALGNARFVFRLT